MRHTKLLVTLASVLAGASCGSRLEDKGGTDSSTHFWDSCSSDSECGDANECICGRCTKSCEQSTDCSGESVTCIAASARLSCGIDELVCAPGTLDAGVDESTTVETADASVSDESTFTGDTVFWDASVVEQPSTDDERSTAEMVGSTSLGNLRTSEYLGTSDGIPDSWGQSTGDTEGGASCVDEEGCPWTSLASLPEQVANAIVAAFEDHIYVLGGSRRTDFTSDSSNSPPWNDQLPTSYVYDASLGQWSERTTSPVEFGAGAAGVIADKVYIVTAGLQPLIVYNTSTDIWSTGATVPDIDLGISNIGVETTVASGQLYVIGGVSRVDDAYETSVHTYDPQLDEWGAIAPIPAAIRNSTVCTLGERIYSFGGAASAVGEGDGVNTETFERGPEQTWIYDLVSSSWSAASSQPVSTERGRCVAIGEYIYVATDLRRSGTLARYHAATDNWEDVSIVPGPFFAHQPQSVGGLLYVLGDDRGRLGANSLWRFNPTP